MRIRWNLIRNDLMAKGAASAVEIDMAVSRLQRDYDAVLRLARTVHNRECWAFPLTARASCVIGPSVVFVSYPDMFTISPGIPSNYVSFDGPYLDDKAVFNLPLLKGYSNPIRREVSNVVFEYYYRRVV